MGEQIALSQFVQIQVFYGKIYTEARDRLHYLHMENAPTVKLSMLSLCCGLIQRKIG
jgi:hypothetical protein